jgi:RNA polymerase sigma-70 factor, ECF subfamily
MRATTSPPALLAVSVENPASELVDIEGLVERHRPRVFRFISASVRDMDVAETLTQDCFFKAHRARQAFRGDCTVQTWLLRIAVNLIRDYARHRRFRFWDKVRAADADEIHEWPDRALSPEDRLSLHQRSGTTPASRCSPAST